MNKKISTLLAAFLAAGFSYTVEAGVVKIAKPVNNGVYVISDGIDVLTAAASATTGTFASTVVKLTAVDASKKALVEWVYGVSVGNVTLALNGVEDANVAAANESEATAGFNIGAKAVNFVAEGNALKATIQSTGAYLAPGVVTTAYKDQSVDLSYYQFATTLSDATNVPFSVGGKYLVIEEGGVVAKDLVEYLALSDAAKTTWTIKDGKVSTAIETKATTTNYLKVGTNGFELTTAASGASVFETVDGKLTAVGTGNINVAVLANGTTSADVDEAVAASTAAPGDFTVPAAANTADKALVGFPAASRLVVYTNTTTKPTAYISKAADVLNLTATYPVDGKDLDQFYWTIDGGKITNAAGKVFSVAGYTEFVMVPAKDNKPFFQLITKDSKYVKLNSDALEITTVATDAATFSAVETATTPVTVEGLNKQVGNGFDLSIYTKKDGTKDVEGADIFAGVLTAEGVNSADNDEVYYLKNAEGKYLALNNDKTVDGAVWGGDNNMNGNNNTGFKFTTVDKKDAEKVYTKFKIETADNGASQLVVRVMDNTTTPAEFGRLFITKFDGKYYLTTKKTLDAGEAWPYIVYGSNNRVDIKTLLKGQFVNVAFANRNAKVDNNGNVITNEKYKLGGVLAIAREALTANAAVAAEYVPSNNVLSTSPETQWAIQYVADGNNSKATFVNREDPSIKVSDVVLYQTGVENVYAVTSVKNGLNVTANDTIRLSFVNHTMFDGFKYVDPAGLNDTVYNVAAYKAVNNVNNAYWVEKNHSTTHQIGLDGDAEKAGNWNLRLATKTMDKKEVIDTVFVISEMSVLKDGKVADKMKKDTLAILPYAIQNAGNREFVKYDDTKGVEYYICNKDNKTNKNVAARFALKEQPNGTYHLVTIDQLGAATDVTGKPAYAMGVKLFAGNAAKGGTLDNIANYTTTFNDLMVVQPVSAPEYRKVVKEWGDTIRIYRNDNSSQVLYEKLDPKSVVKGESFLNIDNINQFDVNPAIFVDTAYINRGTNTCWQYLLAVNVDKKVNTYCPDDAEHNDPEWIKEHGVCPHALKTNIVKGRFLINLMDTANVYEATHQHDNPYVNEIEAYEFKSKLGFVEGMHVNDTLFITRQGGEVVKLEMDSPNFNIAKFAFRYVDREAGSFKIQTQLKKWKDGDLTKEDYDAPTANQGYLRWVNGTVVVTNSFENGDVFNMEEGFAGDPTANDAISANKVTVEGGNGYVIIKGAAGKTVSISNVLGQTTSTKVTSDNATIAAPAGIVVVAVEGEAAVKAIVK